MLWDLDGTLIDTEPYWFASEVELVTSYGGTWTHEDNLRLVGSPLLDAAADIRARTPVTAEPVALVEALQDGVMRRLRERIPWRPGVLELLGELADLGVPTAMVTMSWRPMVQIVLDALPDDRFDAVVTGEMVRVGKPDPEAYLLGLELLGLPAALAGSCVAIEDSPMGSGSSVAAGIPTLVTPAAASVPPGPGLSILSDLAGVRAADLMRLAGDARPQPAGEGTPRTSSRRVKTLPSAQVTELSCTE